MIACLGNVTLTLHFLPSLTFLFGVHVIAPFMKKHLNPAFVECFFWYQLRGKIYCSIPDYLMFQFGILLFTLRNHMRVRSPCLIFTTLTTSGDASAFFTCFLFKKKKSQDKRGHFAGLDWHSNYRRECKSFK